MAQQDELLPVDPAAAVGAAQAWLLETGVQIGIIILVALGIYMLIVLAGRRILQVSARHPRLRSLSAARENRINTLSEVLGRVAGVVIFLIALLMVLIELGINVTPILTGAGIAGIAIGFGAQDMVKNIFHGIFILLEDQYSEGDVVRVAGISGVVEDFNLRRTVLRDLDGIQHHIPNGEINTASNMTKGWSGIHLDLGVSYSTDLSQAREVIDATGEQLRADFPDDVLEPPAVVGVDAFGDSAIVLKVVGKSQAGRQWEMTRTFRERLKSAFDEAGIEIPFPHRVQVVRREG